MAILSKSIKDIHGNPDYPEYQNIYVPSMEKDTALVWAEINEEKIWKIKPIPDVTASIVKKLKDYVIPRGIPSMQIAMAVKTDEDLDAYDNIVELKKLNGLSLEEQFVVKKSLFDLKDLHT